MSQFGAKPGKEDLEFYSKSKQWDGKQFINLIETKMDMGFGAIMKVLYEQLFKRSGRAPVENLPIVPFNKESFLSYSDESQLIWYGHSVVLLRINGKTILIDPMLGPNASPIAPFATKRFSKNTLDLIDQFPKLDVVLMTHDHYDHLDLDSIDRLKHKTELFYVGLGVGRHLRKWGISSDKIHEFDWWDTEQVGNIQITYTPTRHFSGRGLRDRAKSLWGGWVLKTNTENIYFSGDGGYGEHFKEVGERLGPFDFGFMECGQYHKYWHAIHLYPEESIQAGIDAKVKKVMPVHWAGFSLSLHSWKDPVERFVAEAVNKGASYIVPRIGQQFTIRQLETSKWWDNYQ